MDNHASVRRISFGDIAKSLHRRLNFGPFKTLVCCSEEGLQQIELRRYGPLTWLTLPRPINLDPDELAVYSRDDVIASVAEYAAPAYPFDDANTLRELIRRHFGSAT
jgi:hypothetical protein